MTVSRPGLLERASVAFYRLVLQRLLRRPRSSVGAAGEVSTADEVREIVQILREELDEERSRGRLRLVRVLGAAFVDLLGVAITGGFERQPRRRSPRRTGDNTMSRLLDDLRYGFRTLRRSPGYTVTAVVILALAIGANATIFSLVEHLFLASPAHVTEPERLVRVNRTTDMSAFGSLAYPDYQHYRDHNGVFDGLLAYDPDGILISVGYRQQRRSDRGWFVSANYFDVLGVTPAEGRFFRPDEDVVDAAARVVVISHRLWRDLFDRHSPIGETLRLNGHPFTVIGVAPRGFSGVSPIEGSPELWIPITTQPVLSPLAGDMALKRIPDSTWVWLWSIGRLRDDVSLEQAQSNMSTLAAHLEQTYPEWNEGWRVTVSPSAGLHPPQKSSLGSITRVLLLVALAVLLVACSNIAILLLARNSVRRRETGVRKALGASSGRITALLLGESSLIGIAGAIGGFVLAYGCSRLAYRLLPATLEAPPTPGLPVLVFSLALALLAALVFTLAPARQSTRQPAGALLQDGRGSSRHLTVQAVLVGVQVALSTLLVVGGALLVRSLVTVRGLDLGIETQDRVLVGVDLRNHGYSGAEAVPYLERALDSIGAVPGVERAAVASLVPFRGAWTSGFLLEDTDGGPRTEHSSGFNAVSPGYFDTLSIPLVRGRVFDDRDRDGTETVVVVNRAFSERFFAGSDPVGRYLHRGDQPSARIVGMVENATYYELGEEPQPQAYVSLLQVNQTRLNFIAHVRDDSASTVRLISDRLGEIDADVALNPPLWLDDIVGKELGRYRTAATLVGLFAVLALVLASLGLYGALSYLVVRSAREIGIRLALGARPRQVGLRYMMRGATLVAIGATVGILAAAALSSYLAHLLFEVRPLDPASFLLTPAVLIVVAVVASWVPARRAMRTEPSLTMRSE